jgi:hypothetical protein
MLQIIGDLHRCENCLGFGEDRLSRVTPRDMCENKTFYMLAAASDAAWAAVRW